jgi:hypothetical protein
MNILWFRKRKEPEVTVGPDVADRDEKECNRREFCMSQAVYLEGTDPLNIVARAEQIYEYCYGSRTEFSEE